jgi:ABC-2 type transport system permease protein
VKHFWHSLYSRYRYSLILLRQLVITDFKLRYQGSALGYIWSLLRPLALFVILYIVFVKFMGIGADIPNYGIYLLLGIVIWNYFAEVTNNSVTAIVDRGDILRKINFPKYVIVLAGSFSALINLALNFVVVGVFMAITHVQLRPDAALLPLLIIELFVFALSVSFFLSAAFVRLRDLNYIWEVFMQGLFYATPILYALTSASGKIMVPPEAAKVLILSPIAQIIQDARYALVTSQSATIQTLYGKWYVWLIPIGLTVLLAVFAGIYFKRRSSYFAEEV